MSSGAWYITHHIIEGKPYMAKVGTLKWIYNKSDNLGYRNQIFIEYYMSKHITIMVDITESTFSRNVLHMNFKLRHYGEAIQDFKKIKFAYSIYMMMGEEDSFFKNVREETFMEASIDFSELTKEIDHFKVSDRLSSRLVFLPRKEQNELINILKNLIKWDKNFIYRYSNTVKKVWYDFYGI